MQKEVVQKDSTNAHRSVGGQWLVCLNPLPLNTAAMHIVL